jgi:hypothetical protein
MMGGPLRTGDFGPGIQENRGIKPARKRKASFEGEMRSKAIGVGNRRLERAETELIPAKNTNNLAQS